MTPVRPVIRALSAEVQLLDAALLLADDAITPAQRPHAGDRQGPALHVALVPRSESAARPDPRPHDHRLPAAPGPVPVGEHHRGQRHRPADRHAADPRGPSGTLGGRVVARHRGRAGAGARRGRDPGPDRRARRAPPPRDDVARAVARRVRGAGASDPVLAEGLLIALPGGRRRGAARDRARAGGQARHDRHRRRGRRRA